MMSLAILLVYMVYNFFVDLDAADVAEHILMVPEPRTPTSDHALHFLLACLANHNVDNPKPYIAHDVLLVV